MSPIKINKDYYALNVSLHSRSIFGNVLTRGGPVAWFLRHPIIKGKNCLFEGIGNMKQLTFISGCKMMRATTVYGFINPVSFDDFGDNFTTMLSGSAPVSIANEQS